MKGEEEELGELRRCTTKAKANNTNICPRRARKVLRQKQSCIKTQDSATSTRRGSIDIYR